MKEKKENLTENQSKRKRFGIKVGIAVLAALIVACVIYVITPYKASETVAYYFDPDMLYSVAASDDEYQSVTLTTSDDGTIVAECENPIAGLIFYPGGRVEHDAYVPLIYAFAQRGITCVLVDMPLNFAVFDIDAAADVRNQFSEIDKWYIGGHSLGGAMAASYVADHCDEYEGLILLGSYSTKDLSNSGLKVFLAYGTQDGVINRGNYSKCLKNLPMGSSELIVVGGCHAYFGDYGKQFRDGHPYITREEQIKYTADAFIEYILQETK